MKINGKKGKNKRQLIIYSNSVLDEASEIVGELRDGFVVLVPAYVFDFSDQVKLTILSLVKRGCSEICFVGPFCDFFHDACDFYLEDFDYIDVITTACEEDHDAIEYVVYGAGAASCDILALIAGRSELEEKIASEWRSYVYANDGGAEQ